MKNKEIAEKINQIKRFVTSYTYENMKDVLFKMDNRSAWRAKFKTTGGLEVYFTYGTYDNLQEEPYAYVEALGQVNNIPLRFALGIFEWDRGNGRIFFGKYGIEFCNVGTDKREPTIKPFRFIQGRAVYLCANNVLNKMIPLVEQLFEDIKTITPSEQIETFSKPQKNTSDKNNAPEKITTSKIEDLKELKLELSSLCSFHESLNSDDLTEEQSFKK